MMNSIKVPLTINKPYITLIKLTHSDNDGETYSGHLRFF